MRNLFFIIIVIVVIAIGAVLFMNAQDQAQPMSSTESLGRKDDAMMVKDQSKMSDAKNSEQADEVSSYSGSVLAGSTTPFIAFNKADYDKALAERKIILLDFYANWCPICRAEAPAWIEAFNSLRVPNAVGFKVNYNDPETDQDEKNLAKQLGVTYQHTKVLIKDGKAIQKVTEQWDASQIKSAVEAAAL